MIYSKAILLNKKRCAAYAIAAILVPVFVCLAVLLITTWFG